MGVQISDLLPKEKIDTKQLTGKKIAIDAFNWIYQFLSSIRQYDGTPLQDSKGRITSHLSGLFYRTANLIENGVRPVYVFDGEPPKFKHGTTTIRKEIKEGAKRKWEEAVREGNLEEAKKYAQQTSELTEDMVKEGKELLEAMGVAVVQAKSEGEAQCAYLCKEGLVYSTASQDADSLLFGSPLLIRNLNITGKRKIRGKEIRIEPEMIKLESLLKNLDISRDQLIILGILVGTDYNHGGIRGIGPKKALDLVKKFKTLGEVLKNVKWDFEVDAKEIFEFFKNPPVEKIKEIKFGKLNETEIKRILCDKHDFSEQRVDNVLKKISSPPQSSISSFLGS